MRKEEQELGLGLNIGGADPQTRFYVGHFCWNGLEVQLIGCDVSVAWWEGRRNLWLLFGRAGVSLCLNKELMCGIGVKKSLVF